MGNAGKLAFTADLAVTHLVTLERRRRVGNTPLDLFQASRPDLDRLGLDVVHIQAKRWQGTVGRPQIQAFAGSLEGQRSRKGVFITTSQFSQDAREYVSRIEKKIILIDGEQLADLMIGIEAKMYKEQTMKQNGWTDWRPFKVGKK